MASALLAHGDYNVVIVRWGGGANCLYSQATANTRLVGLEVANLVNKLVVICCPNFILKISDKVPPGGLVAFRGDNSIQMNELG